MRDAAVHRITESGNFEWPWAAPTGLAIITGAGGGGGGEGANATTLQVGEQSYQAAGGAGGGFDDGHPVNGIHGKGCHYGLSGGDGGAGAVAPPAGGRLVSNGGNGGKGFPGESLLVDLQGLSKGDEIQIEVGRGGGHGGGIGYETEGAGAIGADGFVILVRLHVHTERGQC